MAASAEGHAPADRVLRIDARRTAACSSYHGWGDLQDELNALSKQGEWVEMGELIDDDILDTFAVVGEPEQIARRAARALRRRRRPGQLLRPVRADPERWHRVMEQLHAA